MRTILFWRRIVQPTKTGFGSGSDSPAEYASNVPCTHAPSSARGVDVEIPEHVKEPSNVQNYPHSYPGASPLAAVALWRQTPVSQLINRNQCKIVYADSKEQGPKDTSRGTPQLQSSASEYFPPILANCLRLDRSDLTHSRLWKGNPMSFTLKKNLPRENFSNGFRNV